MHNPVKNGKELINLKEMMMFKALFKTLIFFSSFVSFVFQSTGNFHLAKKKKKKIAENHGELQL